MRKSTVSSVLETQWQDSGEQLEETQLLAFQCEQLFLEGKAAAKTSQIAIAPDDAMARNDDGYGIGSIRKAHGAGCVGTTDAPRQLAVADGFSVRNLLEVAPDEQLKFRAFEDQGQIKILPFSREVFL